MLFSRCYILPTIHQRYTVRVLLNMPTWRAGIMIDFSYSCFMFTTSCLLSSTFTATLTALLLLESRTNDLSSFITFLPYRYNGRRSYTRQPTHHVFTSLYARKSHTQQSFLNHPSRPLLIKTFLLLFSGELLLHAFALHIHTYPRVLTHTHGVSRIIVPPLSCPRC